MSPIIDATLSINNSKHPTLSKYGELSLNLFKGASKIINSSKFNMFNSYSFIITTSYY